MESINIQTLAQWCGGRLLQGDSSAQTTSVSTDSRTIASGELFVALQGDHFDGSRFLADAVARGAVGAVVAKASSLAAGVPARFALIQVADTLAAFQKMAAAYRRSLPLKVVAITGSNGKTSTKDFTAAVLAERFRVVKTEGNFNNHIGLPQTILRASGTDRIGVFELGMNHPGEIEPLAKIAAPDVGIITNVGTAHIGNMGSRDAIAKEKGMLAEAIGEAGHLVLNADDEFSKSIAARTKARVVFAGIGCGDVRVTEIRPQPEGSRFTLQAGGESVESWLGVPGVHMIQNATLAVAAGRIFGLTLSECALGLQKTRFAKGRLEAKTVGGIRFLDDSYNANPDSMFVAIRTLMQMPDCVRRIAVLGQMNELGNETGSGHRQVGEAAAREGVHCLITVGELARQIGVAACEGGVGKTLNAETVEEAAVMLRKIARTGDVVLVKGSRGARMERVIEAFANAPAEISPPESHIGNP